MGRSHLHPKEHCTRITQKYNAQSKARFKKSKCETEYKIAELREFGIPDNMVHKLV